MGNLIFNLQMASQSKRYVFKILGAVGPGGAWVTMLE